jgi:hypothetical protein
MVHTVSLECCGGGEWFCGSFVGENEVKFNL